MESSVIKELLNKYEAALGQSLNLSKSGISFSKNLASQAQHSVFGFFGIKEVNSHTQYLGYPTIIGLCKKLIFSYIKKCIWRKLKG